MTRRDLLKYLLSTPIAATLDVEKLLWVPKPIVTVPKTAYGKIMGFSNPTGPNWMKKYWIIPYHGYNATAGLWLGMNRNDPIIYDEIIDMIDILKLDKLKDP